MKKYFLSAFCIASVIIVQAHTDTTLNEYTGKYHFPSGSIVRHINISIEDSTTLFVKATLGSVYLNKVAADSFSVDDYSGYVVFIRNEAKSVVGLRVKVNKPDVDMEGTKDTDPVSNNSSSPVTIINDRKQY